MMKVGVSVILLIIIKINGAVFASIEANGGWFLTITIQVVIYATIFFKRQDILDLFMISFTDPEGAQDKMFSSVKDAMTKSPITRAKEWNQRRTQTLRDKQDDYSRGINFKHKINPFTRGQDIKPSGATNIVNKKNYTLSKLNKKGKVYRFEEKKKRKPKTTPNHDDKSNPTNKK